MPLLSLLAFAMPLDASTLCAMSEFPADLEPAAIDVAAVESVLAGNDDCLAAHYLRAFAEFEGEGEPDFDVMIRHMERALELAPSNADVLRTAGQAWLSRAGAESSLSDAKKGRTLLEKAIEADPDDLAAMSALASFHRQAPWIAGGDMDDAYELAERIGKLDPKRGLIEEARTRLADSEDGDAIALMRKAVEQNPENAAFATEYAVLMHRYDEFKEAHRVLYGVTRFSDAHPGALYQLGRTAALSGDFIEDGREALQRYLARVEAGETLPIAPAAAWWRLGMIEQHAGDVSAARIAFERALEVDPDFDQAADALRDLD